MKDDNAVEIIRLLRDEAQLIDFAGRLNQWLLEQTRPAEETGTTFSESRAKATLRAAGVIDDATIKDFVRLSGNVAFVRVALYDLVEDSGISRDPEAKALATASAVYTDSGSTAASSSISWLTLSIAAYAWKRGYPVQQLDPASPPDPNSPAGQVLKRAAHLFRRQVQRNATDRDRLNRKLTQPPTGAPTLEELTLPDTQAAPMPPHYRPPIPENYPEISDEMLQVDPNEAVVEPVISIGDPLVITEDELGQPAGQAGEIVRMPPITINPEQVPETTQTPPSPMPSSGVVVPNSTSQTRPGFSVALRQMLGHEELTTTKLHVLAQQYPDGPGLYGLQIRVRCKGIKSQVAGTTDRDGKFICELPVRMNSGLTYDVEVTWPRDQGNEVERKSITLNADRTHFTVPFYRQLKSPDTTSGVN